MSTCISITTSAATPFGMRLTCNERCSAPAAIDKSGRHVQPDDRTSRNALEVDVQQARELSGRRKNETMNVRKCDESSVLLEYTHHLLQESPLHRFGKDGPRQP